MTTYLVAWTGGYEMPGYFVTPDKAEAEAKFAEWLADRKEQSDSIQVLEISEDGRTIEVIRDDQEGDDEPEDEEEYNPEAGTQLTNEQIMAFERRVLEEGR